MYFALTTYNAYIIIKTNPVPVITAVSLTLNKKYILLLI